MILEVLIILALIVYLIITYLQHLRTQSLIRSLSICVGYNIAFLRTKFDDYEKTPQDK